MYGAYSSWINDGEKYALGGLMVKTDGSIHSSGTLLTLRTQRTCPSCSRKRASSAAYGVSGDRSHPFDVYH